jgi:hypothetical protein
MSDQFTPQEQLLIQRLQRAPQPELNQAVFEAIRLRVLDALDAPPVPAPPALPAPTIIVAVVIVVIAAIIIAVVASQQNSSTPLVVPSATPVMTESPTPTVTITPTPLPTLTPLATVKNITVIEGAVEVIDGNVVTIFGVEVQVAPDDPLLNTIQIGDVIRVEGNTDGVVVLATTIIHVNIDVTVNPSSGEVWRDDGSCTNPPPDWAPANGWRRRCQGGSSNNNDQGMGIMG